MKFACTVDDGREARRFEQGDFPLALGGSDADIELPGLDGGPPAAFLALDGGELFVQPQGTSGLLLAGQPITASHWLRDGDEIRLAATRIRVSWRAGGPHLRVEQLSLDQPTEPPAIVAAGALQTPASDALVRPAGYRPKSVALAGQAPRPPRRRPRPVAMAATLALVAAGAFLFAARAVEVKVEPEPERLAVRGAILPAVGGVRLLLPGRYAVLAEREGYRPLEAPLEVTAERRQVARFELERLPGRLALEVTPPSGVRLAVDGEQRGITPLAPVEVTPGEHEITLRAEGYAAFTTRLVFAGGGELQRLAATLTPDRAPVSFSSDPAGASVRVDGSDLGRTPLTVDLSSGRRTVEVGLSGHRTAARSIDVVAGSPLSVPAFRLEALPGRLALGSDPPGAAVSVDGRFRGETPIELLLEPDTDHALRLTKAAHEAVGANVRLGKDEARSLDLTLAPQVGEVEVAAEPADAELLVDGESRGRAQKTLRLSAAPHAIEIRREGYEPHRVSVTPRPGFPQAVKVRLKSLEEAKAAARPRMLTVRGHQLRLLTPGRFQMGASRREPGRRANETVREVELSRHFYLAAHEVTNAQFRRFKPDHSSGRFGNYDLDGNDQPAVQVTWEQAAEYCNWLSAQEGLPPAYARQDGKLLGSSPLGNGYRLPTEAEWSRAARYAESGPLKYPWGATLPVPPRAGNYADESARPIVAAVLQGYDDRHPVSAPVGAFAPNALGLFDLGGNVAEWVHDVYSIPPAEAPVERDPTGPAAGDLHVILGSSFLQGAVGELRLSYRDYGTKPRLDVGFRVARYAE